MSQPKPTASLVVLVALSTTLLGFSAPAAETKTAAKPAPAASAADAKVERGRYLVTIGGCNDCHTPFHLTEEGPEPDMSRMLSGHPQQLELPPPPALPEGPWVGIFAGTNTAWAGPWGVSFPMNLTPDLETGIGAWTEEEFVGTLRTGRHRGRGRQILPPMPWQNYGQATDEDLSAIFAYLRTIPAISNRVPDPLPPAQ